LTGKCYESNSNEESEDQTDIHVYVGDYTELDDLSDNEQMFDEKMLRISLVRAIE
jgi:hypothetical protein